jgi:hypothetical protein
MVIMIEWLEIVRVKFCVDMHPISLHIPNVICFINYEHDGWVNFSISKLREHGWKYAGSVRAVTYFPAVKVNILKYGAAVWCQFQ